jgi:hypothetical protein
MEPPRSARGAGRDWLPDAGIPADAGPPHHGEDRMTFEVAHDGTARRDPMENCALCRLKDADWYKKSDVAVCPVCAEKRLASEIPPKKRPSVGGLARLGNDRTGKIAWHRPDLNSTQLKSYSIRNTKKPPAGHCRGFSEIYIFKLHQAIGATAGSTITEYMSYKV